MTRYSNAILYKLKAKENAKRYLSNTFLNLFIFQARGDSNHGGGCVTLQLRGETGGASTKVAKKHFNENLSFFAIMIFCSNPSSQKVTVSLTTEKGKEVSQFRYVSAFQ